MQTSDPSNNSDRSIVLDRYTSFIGTFKLTVRYITTKHTSPSNIELKKIPCMYTVKDIKLCISRKLDCNVSQIIVTDPLYKDTIPENLRAKLFLQSADTAGDEWGVIYVKIVEKNKIKRTIDNYLRKFKRFAEKRIEGNEKLRRTLTFRL